MEFSIQVKCFCEKIKKILNEYCPEKNTHIKGDN